MNRVNTRARLANPDALKAYDDLWQRTLGKIPGDLNRMIYLASTRDYNSGRYHHAGLEATFGYDAVKQALETAHLFFFSSRRRHTRLQGDWSSDVCSSD